MVAHTFNPSYSGGTDQKDCGLKPTWAKKLVRPTSQPIRGMVVYSCDPRYVGGIGRGIMVGGWPVQMCETLSEK
jgi:hypothetical protein